MKKKVHLAMIATLLLSACNPYSEHVIRGTLYADSTQTTPLADKTLNFYEGEAYYDFNGFKYLGHAVSDTQGRWAFQYIRGLDNPYQQSSGAKLSMTEYEILITCDGDTLYSGSPDAQNITVYPGCWQNPYIHRPITDTTSTEGGRK